MYYKVLLTHLGCQRKSCPIAMQSPSRVDSVTLSKVGSCMHDYTPSISVAPSPSMYSMYCSGGDRAKEPNEWSEGLCEFITYFTDL